MFVFDALYLSNVQVTFLFRLRQSTLLTKERTRHFSVSFTFQLFIDFHSHCAQKTSSVVHLPNIYFYYFLCFYLCFSCVHRKFQKILDRYSLPRFPKWLHFSNYRMISEYEGTVLLWVCLFLCHYIKIHVYIPAVTIEIKTQNCFNNETIFLHYNFMPLQPPCQFSSVQSLSCVQICDPLDCRTPGLPVFHHLPELTQTHVLWVGGAI